MSTNSQAPAWSSPDTADTPDSGLHIPEVRDGLFGYNEERSLQLKKYRSHIVAVQLLILPSPVFLISPVFSPGAQRPGALPSLLQLTSLRLREPEIPPLLLELPDAVEPPTQFSGWWTRESTPNKVGPYYYLTDFGPPFKLEVLYDSFRRCLDLRDKYMLKSLQMLGHDLCDHNGVFHGLSPALADVSRGPTLTSPLILSVQGRVKPPPHHWHWTDREKERMGCSDGKFSNGEEQFVFENCEIPAGPYVFEIDDKGVFQICSSIPYDKKPLFDIPSIRECFVNLDYVLGVISDGPAKSFAFRRLKYLAGKFGMYLMSNEFQELAT